jgi:uncharacterized protein (TIGR02117 family)
MRRFLKWLVMIVVALPLAVVLLYAFTMRFGDAALYPPAKGAETFPVVIADHGYHAGLIIRRADLDRYSLALNDPVLSALFVRYQAYEWLEIGWGDEQFYRFAPAISDVTVKMAFNALSGMNDATVLHVVGLSEAPEEVFKHSDLQRISLSEAGMREVMKGVSLAFAKDALSQPVELGKGIYGPSLFYRANGHYSMINTCNMWIGGLLANAGLKVSPVPSVASVGLLAEIRWRNDLAEAVAANAF